jgi:hypothetical protein
MPLQKRLWSLNALATELCIDRRTLAKRLEGLRPSEVKRIGGRTEKRWRLEEVVQHLEKPKARHIDTEAWDGFKQILGQNLFPALAISEGFMGLITGAAVHEFGLSKIEALRLYQFAVLALVRGLCEIVGDEELCFEVPPPLTEMQELGLEEYVRRYCEADETGG